MFWQQKNWDYLISRRRNNTLPHALLLYGANGLGKLLFAKKIAGVLLCNNNGDLPCGQCRSCQLLSAGNHPDLLLVQPEAAGKAIKIDQVREMIVGVHHTAQQGGFRVIIIEPADSMNSAAANALLKTLEEPQDKNIIILVTNKTHVLPATIRSRCQQLLFLAPMFTEARKWLVEKIPEAQNIDFLLAQTGNAPLGALALYESGNYQSIDALIADFMLVSSGKMDAIKFATTIGNFELSLVLTNLMNLISDLIKLKFNNNDHLINQDKIMVLQTLANRVTMTKLFSFYDLLLEICRLHEVKINMNKNLLLEKLMLNWLA